MKQWALTAGALAATVAMAAALFQPDSPSAGDRGGIIVKRTGEPDARLVASDDPAMQAAIRRARATVGTFIAALQARRAGQKDFALKKLFRDGHGAEHMWMSRLSFDGSLFHGRLDNDPLKIKSVKLGDAATCAPSEISDWVFLDRGRMVGGTTIRLFTSKMPPSERKKFQKESGYHF